MINQTATTLAELKSFTLQAVEKILGELQSISSATQQHDQTLMISNQISSDVDKPLAERITKLEHDVENFTRSTDQQSIKFAGLGFRTLQDADEWMHDNCLNKSKDRDLSSSIVFGLLPDFHITMEFLKKGSSIAQLIKAARKMEFSRLAQGIAIDSFNAKVPDFFTADMSNTIVHETDSYFTCIRTYEEWSTPYTGKKAKLRAKLTDFSKYYRSILDSGSVNPLSSYYNLCMLAMNESVSSIED